MDQLDDTFGNLISNEVTFGNFVSNEMKVNFEMFYSLVEK